MEQTTFFGVPAVPCFPKTKDGQGQQAVKSGLAAEATIYCILKERGYVVERQFPVGVGIYGTELHADFYVTRIPQFPTGLIIESKWQELSGSVDEKFPYLVENIRRYPCPTLIVYGGGGARSHAIDWMRRQADGDKILAVLSFEEFLTWTIRNL